MKPHTLPVKRRPVSKGIFKRLSAVTANRKQRVAAAASADMEVDDSSSKISRALTIVFLFHIVAIGLIFVHQKFLDGRTPAAPQAAKAGKVQAASPVAAAAAPRRADLPRLSSGDKPYIVRAGDNYARIAAAEAVDEGDLRLINEHVDIGPGLILKIPPKRIVAVDPPEVTAIRNQVSSGGDSGLVDAVPVSVSGAPRAQLVRPNIMRGAQTVSAPATASGKTYVVQNGDSVWRIANRFKVNQDALMKANGLSDARKLRGGMSLVIPQ
jgi:LysM repeat protein